METDYRIEHHPNLNAKSVHIEAGDTKFEVLVTLHGQDDTHITLIKDGQTVGDVYTEYNEEYDENA